MNIDLNNPPQGQTYNLALERIESDDDRRVRLFKEVALFCCGLVATMVVLGLALAVTVSEQASPDDRKWAMALPSAAFGAILGYLLKR
ncbi:hypothetical protein [Brevundimonas balnearis]|uniref:Transmembrane protein n=1 Tax=Brevundimonas balnearis TaxID=1572858 RepID=A0ABV6R4H5_9CAUL